MTRAELAQDPGFLGFVRVFLADWIAAGGSRAFGDFATFGQDVLSTVSTDHEISAIVEKQAATPAELAAADLGRVGFASDLMGRI